MHLTAHFHQELKNANASLIDVETLLLGNCTVKAEYRVQGEYQGWKYKSLGCDEEGQILTVVVSLDVKCSTMVMITAF